MGQLLSHPNGIIAPSSQIECECVNCHDLFIGHAGDGMTIKGPTPKSTLCKKCYDEQVIRSIDEIEFRFKKQEKL